MKFVSLSPDQLSELDAVMQSKDCDKRSFKRLQSIKLNARGYSILQVSELLGVHYNSAYNWITRYEKEGVAGLQDKPKSGRPTILTEEDKERVEAFIKETPQQPKVVLARVEAELHKSISRDTLRRVLKGLDHTYRRVKKSLRSKRDDQKFEEKKERSKP
jgi:transposase